MQDFNSHKLITTSPLFQQLSTEETALVLARLQLSHYERHVSILEQGIWHGRLYIIASGMVNILLQDTPANSSPDFLSGNSTDTMERSRYRVASLGPGECFGEMSLLTGEPPTATVRTEEETNLWSLTHADFLALATTCPTLLHNMNSILSQRLARTNRQLLLEQAAEVLLVEILDTPPITPPLQALAYHIAAALALRSQQRVLLLELCTSDESHCLRFATHPGQRRPELLTCAKDATLFQAHHTSLHANTGEMLIALTTLAATREQLSISSANLSSVLLDLMLLYDYILLAITATTSELDIDSLLHDLKQRPQRALCLLSAQSLPTMISSSRIAHYAQTTTLFITQVANKPTLGLQDQYTQQVQQPVKRLLPADEPLLERCWQEERSLHQLAPRATLTQGVDFVARFIAHQTVGIAFGGGGARGFAHLGVLTGLLEHEVPLDYIAACSIGILAPGMYLLGKSFEESEQMFLEIQHHLGQWHLSRTSLMSNRGLKLLLQRSCGDVYFEDLTTPFAMVAADLATRAGVVLERGPIWQAGLASVALPGIFPPVIVGEHILVDAGMHDPVPIRLVRQMGADVLLASELGGQEPPSLVSATSWSSEKKTQAPPHIVDLLLRSYDLAMATIGMHSIREADVVIRPKLHRVSLRQFSEGRSFIANGRETVEQVIPQIRQHLPWLL